MAVNVLKVGDSAVMRAMIQIQTPFITVCGAPWAGKFGPVNAVRNLSVESGICRVDLRLDAPVPAKGVGS
jgi:hypothetical protein